MQTYLLAALCCVVVAMGAPLRAATHYVTPNGAGTMTGTDWANASNDLYAVLQLAVSGDEVWVAQGTYTPTTCTGTCDETDRLTAFPLKAGVSIIGGFVGNETLRVQASASNTTILSGDIGIVGDIADNSYSVLLCNNCGVTAGLENFTITAGHGNRINSNGPTERGRAGAAVYLDGAGGIANPVFTSCIFRDNAATGRGGAIYGNGFGGESSPVFRFCEFSNNQANNEGGAIAFDGPGGTVNPKFSDCRFINNQTVTASTIGQTGGAIFLSASNGNSILDLDRTLFQGNIADRNIGSGTNNNTAGNGGAIYATSSANLTINARNVIFDQNQAFSAGAVYIIGGTLNLTNCTVTNNLAGGNGGSGGGIYLNNSQATVVNTIIYDNDITFNPFGGYDVRFVDGTLNISHSLVEAASETGLFSRASPAGNDQLNAGPGMIYGQNPLLTQPAGYPEITAATSPAIDAGSNAAVSGSHDFTGASRIQNGTVDLGAVESSLAPLPVELISFSASAEAAAIMLEWQSASEVDLSGYRLERRNDDGSYASLVFVPAMQIGNYRYLDRTVAAGQTYYYRLTSVDYDGTNYTSDLVSATVTAAPETSLLTELYPNPSQGQLLVKVNPSEQPRTVYASIIDASGQKLKFWPLTSDGEHVLNIQDLPSGNYLIRFTAGAYAQSERFVLQH